jgi:DNA adenine methylase
MKAAIDAPKRPALRYYGGKWNLAPWIISHFPEHKNYVEPCGGAASVLLQKPRSPLETYNDLDSNVVNFFRVLRDRPDELIQRLKLTPWARAEYELSLKPCEDELEAARRFFVSSWMSMQGGHHSKTSKTWRAKHNAVHKDGGTRWAMCPTELIKNVDGMAAVWERLRLVQLENRPAKDVIGRYDNKDTLIYFDPPYMPETRSNSNTYLIEQDADFHIESATLLRQAHGFVIVSGYASPIYTELYEAHSWRRVDKESQTNSGGKRIESLWISPRTWAALRKPRQLSVFD